MTTLRSAALAAVLLVAHTVACGVSDPRAEVLEQRARWDVQPLDWVETPDGSINLSVRLSGPPNSKIEQLTVRIELMDGTGESIRQVWHTFDLTKVPRGGPKDISLRLAAGAGSVESVGLSLVLDPTAEEAQQIRELQDL